MRSLSQSRFFLCGVITAGVLLTALFSAPVSAITVTDDSNTTITLTAAPSRIVSLSPSNTEILAALGLSDRIAGITDVCDYPPEVKNKTRIGGYSAISIEKVAAAQPDLVVASDLTPKETVQKIRGLGIPVMVVAPKDIDHVLRDIRLVGNVTGADTEADALAENLSLRIAAAFPPAAGKNRPTIAHVVWHEPLYVSGSNTLQDDVMAHAGGMNVFAGKRGWGTVSLENLLMANPDIIIVNGGGGMDSSQRDVILEEFMTNPQYASLAAVRNGHVYAVNADILSRPGPRLADAAEEVSCIIRTVESERAASVRPESESGTARKTLGFSVVCGSLAILAAAAGTRR